MGHIYAEVEIKGTKAEKKVSMFVDTGATRTIIPYELAEEVGAYKTPFHRSVVYGDGNTKQLEVADVIIRVVGRETPCQILLDNIDEPILGVETLEDLGLKVDPRSGQIWPSREWLARA